MKQVVAGATVAAIVSIATPALAQQPPAAAQASIEQRKQIYAPWSPDAMTQRRKEQGLKGPGPQRPVPAPAFPSYLKKPNTIEELMPQARAAARQTGGRTPLGLALPGKKMVIFVGEIRDAWPNMMVQDAIKRALEERGVKIQIVTMWDAMGLSEADFRQVREALREYTISDGQRELDSFFTTTGQMVDFQKGRQWVKDKDPDLFKATWPDLVIKDPKLSAIANNYIARSSDAVVAWLDKNPQIDWVMWRGANRPNTRKAMKHHGEKFLGNYTYLDLYDLMSQVPSFPADVWRQIEMKTIEPLGFVERAEVTDPEGTAFGYDLKENEAQAWAAGVYQQGHLYMFPAQATGRFPYSVVEYPVMTSKFVPGVLPEVSGVIASTTSHAATHPRIEVVVKNGKISDIKGGGLYGEGMRLLQQYPGTQDMQWPHHQKSGYWWLYEAGMGTNPKYFKHPIEVLEGINLSERNVAGVIHWAFGAESAMGPDKIGEWSDQSKQFSEKNVLPMGHSLHHHNLLPTMQVKIRELDQWITLLEHGGLGSFEDVGVRALASRYGNPNDILRRDYIAPMPGVNMPGTYDSYARDPGAHWVSWAKAIEAGTYPYFKP
jgi:hypothetical protein